MPHDPEDQTDLIVHQIEKLSAETVTVVRSGAFSESDVLRAFLSRLAGSLDVITGSTQAGDAITSMLHEINVSTARRS